MTVVILEDAAEDLESGARFYESCAKGVGDYFLDAILSDLDSLVLFAGVHRSIFDFIECYRRDFHSASPRENRNGPMPLLGVCLYLRSWNRCGRHSPRSHFGLGLAI